MAETKGPNRAILALLVILVVLLAGQTLALVSIRSRLADAERARQEAVDAREHELAEAVGKLESAAGKLASALGDADRRHADPTEEILGAALLLSRTGSASTRCAAARALKDMQDERAEARLAEMAAKDTSQYARNEALGGLAESGSPRFAEVFVQAWSRGGMDQSARRHYVRRLKYLRNTTACKLLVYVIHHDANPQVVEEAAEDLVEIITRRDVAILGKAAEVLCAKAPERSGKSLKMVIEALGKMDDIRATGYLIPCLSHKEAGVAREAAKALGRLKDPLAARPLVEALAREGLRSTVEEVLTEGYPGVRRDDSGAFTLVRADELNKLIAERKEKLKRRLDEIKRLDEDVSVF